MTLAPHPRSTAADLLRLLAAWLAAIVLVQGVAAAQALGLGPLHRHSDAAAAHHHDVNERHLHAAADASVVSSADDPDFNATAFAITAALALMAIGQSRRLTDLRRHVWRAARAWFWRTVTPALLRRPPKPG
jgi:hypothetical protein